MPVVSRTFGSNLNTEKSKSSDFFSVEIIGINWKNGKHNLMPVVSKTFGSMFFCAYKKIERNRIKRYFVSVYSKVYAERMIRSKFNVI